MDILHLSSPFKAPIFHKTITTSTMEDAKALAMQGVLDGTVVIADQQQNGRGRFSNRQWYDCPDKSLSCTILFRLSTFNNQFPVALPLRAGLTISLTLEELFPFLASHIQIKWPNDVLVNSKKVCGVLCESDGFTIYIGIGINVAQKEFPPELQDRATSLVLEAPSDIAVPSRFDILERLLYTLRAVLFPDSEDVIVDWQSELNKRLYKIGCPVRFLQGNPESNEHVEGIVQGINARGELLIQEKNHTKPTPCISGEIMW